MLASHCPEVDTRWSYECGILNFARNSSRILTSVNQQQKSLRCLPKITRLHSNTTRSFQEGITKATRKCDFNYNIYTQAMRRSHDAIRRLHGFVLCTGCVLDKSRCHHMISRCCKILLENKIIYTCDIYSTRMQYYAILCL